MSQKLPFHKIASSRAAWMVCVFALFIQCKQPEFHAGWLEQQAPAHFIARFETTKGAFEISVDRRHSPAAADRFYQLVSHGYFDDGIFYRVVPGFVAQFGNTDTLAMNKWRQKVIPDEPIRLSNQRGTMSFARYGVNSRDLELFINLKDNTQLDTLQQDGAVGFPAFGKITMGMEVVEKLYGGYGEVPMHDGNLYQNRPLFYKSHPKLDLIKKAFVVGKY